MEGVLMQAPSGANKIMVMRQPVGVSVLVTPWNFPAAIHRNEVHRHQLVTPVIGLNG